MVLQGLLIPFLGTALGSACVFFMKREINRTVERALQGFAAGVMVAASVWSLLLPAMEQSAVMEKLSFVPAAVGFWLGILFLLLLTDPFRICIWAAVNPKGQSASWKGQPCWCWR